LRSPAISGAAHSTPKPRTRTLAFNTAEGWSRDVTDEIADELRARCAERGEIPYA
jgi:hypothetical protein